MSKVLEKSHHVLIIDMCERTAQIKCVLEWHNSCYDITTTLPVKYLLFKKLICLISFELLNTLISKTMTSQPN